MSPLEQLQLFVHGRLANEEYFTDIGLYLMRPRRREDGTMESVPQIIEQIEMSLKGLTPKGGKAGVAVTVFMPVVTVPEADAQGFFAAGVVLRVQEDPLINMGASGTQKSAESIGIEVIRALNGWVPHGISNQLYCDREALVWNEAETAETGKWTYDVTVATNMVVETPIRVAMPRIAVDESGPVTMAITCSTPDAKVYYTLDESYPGPANAAALLYSESVLVAESAHVFAAAYKAGLSGSHVQSHEITVA